MALIDPHGRVHSPSSHEELTFGWSILRLRPQDPVSFPVDTIELVLREVPFRTLDTREPLDADRVAFVWHRVVSCLLFRLRGARLLGEAKVFRWKLGTLLRLEFRHS